MDLLEEVGSGEELQRDNKSALILPPCTTEDDDRTGTPGKYAYGRQIEVE